jgi:DNA invertase Pin-like site-specific DNA recombinase
LCLYDRKERPGKEGKVAGKGKAQGWENEAHPMTRAALYSRQSQENDEMLEAHLAECRAYAAEQGWTVVGEYADNGKSGYSRTTKRRQFEAMLESVRKGEVDRVVAANIDRLFRHDKERIQVFEVLTAAGHKGISYVEGQDADFTSADGRRAYRDAGSSAQHYSERLSEKMLLAAGRRRQAGTLHGGGRKPWGYRRVPGQKGLEVEPAEARAIQEAVARIIGGEPLHRIAVDFAQRDVPAPRKPSFIKRALIGKTGKEQKARRRERPLVLGGANWPAVVTEDQYKLVRARLGARSSPGVDDGRGHGRRFALTGIVTCAECGHTMLGSGSYYRCAVLNGGCGKVSIKARSLEDALDQQIQLRRETGRAHDPSAPVAVVADTLAQRTALAELAAVETEAEDLRAAVAAGEITALTGARMIDALEERRSAASAGLATVTPTERPSWLDLLEDEDDDWHERWIKGELTTVELEDLHDMFAAYLEGVRVRAATRRGTFDPSRIQVAWR